MKFVKRVLLAYAVKKALNRASSSNTDKSLLAEIEREWNKYHRYGRRY